MDNKHPCYSVETETKYDIDVPYEEHFVEANHRLTPAGVIDGMRIHVCTNCGQLFLPAVTPKVVQE